MQRGHHTDLWLQLSRLLLRGPRHLARALQHHCRAQIRCAEDGTPVTVHICLVHSVDLCSGLLLRLEVLALRIGSTLTAGAEARHRHGHKTLLDHVVLARSPHRNRSILAAALGPQRSRGVSLILGRY